ncbi:hypothetical protein [Rhizobium leucaenae]|jgi:hypothetical protein|uniref:hypothetical protein n=1 Tax=Rhizobium leucaenae TaxID=29450 RepID=UPI000562383B|nr:hypothetical protein [Rhizobium leucaenae]MBB6305449.1 hypothetical protein [Rhizobium leucaenae]
MRPKEIIEIAEGDVEVRAFLQKLRAAGSLSVRLDDDAFTIWSVSDVVTDEDRDFLTGGGPDEE